MDLKKLKVFFGSANSVIIVFSVLLFTLFLLIFDNSLEAYTSFEMMFIGGHLSGEPLNSYETLAYIGYIDSLKWLYTYNKEVNWLYFLHMLLLYVAFVSVYYSINSIWNSKNNYWNTILLGVLLFIPFGVNILNLNITRESTLLTASGMLILIGIEQLKVKHILLSFFLVLLGILARVETAFLVMFLSIILSFPILIRKPFSIKKYVYFIPNVLLVLIFFSSVMTYRLSSSQYYLSTDIEQYVISDSRFNVVKEYETEKDSIFFEAISGYFINDTSVFNEEKIESFFDKRFLGTETGLLENIKVNISYAFGQLFTVVDGNYLFLLYLMVVLVTLFITRNSYYLLSQLVLLFYLFCIAYAIKMEIYILTPFLIISIYYSMVYLGIFKKNFTKESNIPFAISLYLIVSLFLVKDYFNEKEINDNFSEISKKYLNELATIGKGKIIVIDVVSNQLLIKRPSDLKYFKKESTFYFFDMGQLPLVKQYELYHNKICNCNSLDINQIINFFINNKEEVIFVSIEDRLKFIKKYLKIMHNIKVDFIELPGDFQVEHLDGGRLNYFKIVPIID